VRFMGLDVGKARIGVAVSDETGLIARGIATLQRTSRTKDFEILARLVEENEVGHVVVGNPLNMNGTAGKQSLTMRGFVEQLRSVISVEVSLWDERLSSFTAEQLLIERGRHWSKRKQDIDRLAAVVILQDFLDHHDPKPSVEEASAAEDHGQN
jgi:putative pre-16S rRNA nuclease